MTNRERRILRFVLAITTGFTLSQLINWQLSYLTPILLSMLMGGPNIDLKTGLGFFAVIVVGCLFGLLLSMSIVDYPLVCLLVFSVLLLHIYSAGNRGLSPFAVIMLIMAVTVIPLIGIASINLSWLLVEALTISGFVSVAIALVFFTLIPTEPDPVVEAPAPEGTQLSPEQSALISTLVIVPLLAYYYSFSVTSAIIVMVFAAILAQTVNLATTKKGAAVLILANGLGGIAAVAVYNFLVIAPWWPFMVALIALTATIFADRIFSGKPTAPLYSSAFTAVLLLVGSSVSSDTADAAQKFLARLTQIFLAGAYVVIAFSLLKALSNYLNRDKKQAPGSEAEPGAETGVVTDIGA